MDFKYNEPAFVQELMDYIEDTYDDPANQGLSALEIASENGYAGGFLKGTILEHIQRYSKTNDRTSLLNLLHYGILALHIHDLSVQTSISEEKNEDNRFNV